LLPPRAPVRVKSWFPKFVPKSVKVSPAVVGMLAGADAVTTGASYEKPKNMVPPTTTKSIDVVFWRPEPTRVTQTIEVALFQVVVVHSVPPMDALAVAGAEGPKFVPIKVMVAPDVVGMLGTCSLVMDGASYVNVADREPTLPPMLRFTLVCRRPADALQVTLVSEPQTVATQALTPKPAVLEYSVPPKFMP